MRPVMMIFGTLLLAGNLVLAMPVRSTLTAVKSAEEVSRETRRIMTEVLTERGLERDAAAEIIDAAYGSMEHVSQQIHHFLMLFPEIREDDLMALAAERALRGRTLALHDYDDTIGIIQALHTPLLSESLQSRAVHSVMLNRS